jgi:hypothetical protein
MLRFIHARPTGRVGPDGDFFDAQGVRRAADKTRLRVGRDRLTQSANDRRPAGAIVRTG